MEARRSSRDPRPEPLSGRRGASLRTPQATRVRLSIFDVRGRIVVTLVDRVLPARMAPRDMVQPLGNGAAVASGIYLARLEALGHSTDAEARAGR